VYGNLFLSHMAGGEEAAEGGLPTAQDPRELPFVREALAAIDEGGYPEALARVAALLDQRGLPIPLSRLELKEELIADYGDLLPDLPREQMRRVRGEQEVVVRYEPERAIETLPLLLSDPADRERLLTLLERLLADPRVPRAEATPEQERTLERIRAVLGGKRPTRPRARKGVKS
jgi:hypothetical protein